MECDYAIAHGTLTSLSEQQLVACSGAYGNDVVLVVGIMMHGIMLQKKVVYVLKVVIVILQKMVLVKHQVVVQNIMH